MTPYSWIITADHLNEKTDSYYRVGMEGPFGTEHDWKANPDAGQPFQMFDDDGTLYYEGRYVGDDSEDLFGPLEDMGTPDAGCTGIKYPNAEGKMEFI